MSVMQVVGSSRINNTIYLTVGSVYWTWFLQVTGYPLDVTIETALVVVPIATVIGTVLWAFQFEHIIVERTLYSYTKRSRRGKMGRVWMARTYLVVMPWESSYDIQPSIVETQKREVGRVIKSEILHQEFQDLYQLFWIITMIPPLVYLLSGTILWLQEFVLLASIIIVLIIALPILLRKRGIVKQVLQFAFFSWLHETITRDIENRTTDYRFLGFPEKKLKLREGLQKVSHRVIKLVQQKDWEGFTLNIEHYEPIMEKNLPYYFSVFEYNRVIRYWTWLMQIDLEDYLLFENINVGTKILEEVLDILQQSNRMNRFPELKQSESSFAKRIGSIFFEIVIDRTIPFSFDPIFFEKEIRYLNLEPETDWDPLRVFRVISKETIGLLERKTVQDLCKLLFLYAQQNVPDISIYHTENANGIIRFANFLVESVERVFREMASFHVIPSVKKFVLTLPLLFHHWNIKPKDYFSSCGPLTIHCILEYDVGQTTDEILRWLEDILTESEKLNFESSVQLLLHKFDETNFRKLIAKLDAIRYHGTKELNKQIDLLTEVLILKLNENPKDANSLILRGLYHEEQNRKAMARAVYLEAAMIDKKNVKYLIELGKTMMDHSSYYYDESLCALFKDTLALCEEGDKFYSELVDYVASTCTEPSEYDDDW